IASDKKLSVKFCELVSKKNIKNVYVSSDYLDDDLIERKSAEINSLINPDTKQNTSAFPVAFLHSQEYQLSKNLGEKWPSIVLIFLVFVLPVLLIRRRNLMMYFSASALAGFEIIILLMLQLMIGNMYQLTGLIIAALMAGLAAGSGVNFSLPLTFSLRIKAISLILFYIMFSLVFNYMMEVKSVLLSIILIMLSGFLPALVTGSIFRELTFGKDGLATSPAVYSADLAGSAFGFIIISGIIIPAFGIRLSVFLLSAMVFTGILIWTISNTELKSK
ncbi:MAG TPA: hypothetical protein VFE71_10030, partial [Bacteroidales bacterium]|nr:hypothetical protein [Bacteroidales bacterium]